MVEIVDVTGTKRLLININNAHEGLKLIFIRMAVKSCPIENPFGMTNFDFSIGLERFVKSM